MTAGPVRHVVLPSHSPAVSAPRSLLRVATCGSVDDGKSTLLGRLLFDAGLVPEDQLAALVKESRGRSTSPEGVDVSLLVDGLIAEREQGITIDVAYRYFSTAQRTFVVADSPGHEQYTRNMATAASNADAAIVVVDARRGLLSQTRRHMAVLGLLKVRHLCVVINKMDLLEYDEARFGQLARDAQAFATQVGVSHVTCVPVSALIGENVLRRSQRTSWYSGPSVMQWLETVEVAADAQQAFRMPVQLVIRAAGEFRGVAGMVTAGAVQVNDLVSVAGSPSRRTRVAQITSFEGNRDEARAGESVTLVLDDHVDVSRGDVLTDPARSPEWANQFAADVIWMDGESPLIPERSYLFRVGTRFVAGAITRLKHRLDIERMEDAPADTLSNNEIGLCNIALEQPIAFEVYEASRELGAFIIIDRVTQGTVGAGMIRFPLRRATNISWQAFDTDRSTRAVLMHHQPMIVWLTGLSGSGKSTIANFAERKLGAQGLHTYILDGDNLRHGLNKDLGFTDADRVENVRRAAEVARLMADAGLIVLVSLISPFARERQMAREIAGDIPFLEIFVDTSLEVCAARDPKGLYEKARGGSLKNFTGIDSPYEIPNNPDLRLRTEGCSPEEAADELVAGILAHTRTVAGRKQQ